MTADHAKLKKTVALLNEKKLDGFIVYFERSGKYASPGSSPLLFGMQAPGFPQCGGGFKLRRRRADCNPRMGFSALFFTELDQGREGDLKIHQGTGECDAGVQTPGSGRVWPVRMK